MPFLLGGVTSGLKASVRDRVASYAMPSRRLVTSLAILPLLALAVAACSSLNSVSTAANSLSTTSNAVDASPPAPSTDESSSTTGIPGQPSQSPQDARRDGVVTELAALGFVERVSEQLRVVDSDQIWITSRIPRAT